MENNIKTQDKKFKLEFNDIRALITVINVVLIMVFGLFIAWFGLAVAVLGLLKDIIIDKKINGSVMHLANIILNVYFLLMFYGAI